MELAVVILALVVTLVFAFTNGFHDASSVVATPIACGAASPQGAVIFAACLEMAGAMLGGSAVAYAVQNIVVVEVDAGLVLAVLAAISAAVLWNLLTWRFGLPSSTTHALIGGLVGAVLVSYGPGNILWGFEELLSADPQLVGLTKVLIFLLVSVLVGLLGGFVVHRLTWLLLRRAHRSVNRTIRRAQWLTSGLLAFSHGANDAQKHMGIIALILVVGGVTESLAVPLWVRIACGLMLVLGVLGGGWRIMRTIGSRIFRLEPIHSLDSQIASSSSILVSTAIGAPVSATQIVASSVMGVGAAENAKLVQWSVGKEMLLTWLLTIPAAMALSAIIYYAIDWIV